MGDVFDAMNRAKREGNEPPVPPAPGSGAAAGDDEAPALPLEEVADAAREAAPLAAKVSLSAAAVQRRPVSEAMSKGQAQPPAAAARPTQEVSLNGYAADVVVHHDRGSVVTEQYRAIRTQILARARNRRLQTHVVTSSAPEEGKSVTTANLGVAFAELRNQKTLLIEGDLRRPSFHKLFHRECSPGLLHLLRGEETDLDKVLYPTVYDNLQFLPAGDRDFTGSTELLSSPRMAQVLDRLKDRYDHIFIDTPPVITVTDACILGAMCDETLLVVRLNDTPVEVVDRAKRLLRAAACEVAGVILTHMQFHIPNYVYRYI